MCLPWPYVSNAFLSDCAKAYPALLSELRIKGVQRAPKKDVANIESWYVLCVDHVFQLSILRTLPFEVFWKEGQRQSRKLLYLLRRPGRSTEHIVHLAV